MHITNIFLNNIRGFDKLKLDLSPTINILVGPNNSGKSTILNAIHRIQLSSALGTDDKRIDGNDHLIALSFAGKDTASYFRFEPPVDIHIRLEASNLIIRHGDSNTTRSLIPSKEPENFIYPYLSNRKATNFNEDINLETTNQVTGNLARLYPKIDKFISPQYSKHDEFFQWCKEILGFSISTMSSTGGKRAGYPVDDNTQIPIQAMGAGVSNALGLLVDLCEGDGNLFLIEEIENDLHPTSLRALLKVIIKKSETNQFIITTHSNIVTNMLGAHSNSIVIRVSIDYSSKIPLSKALIVDGYENRKNVLEELGYQFADVNPWEYWLFLEESSAERLIRNYLIPLFQPDLRYKLRTFSSRSLSQVRDKFEDFNQLFVFLNLQEGYKNRAWVILDSGDTESEVVKSLIKTYCKNGWDEDRFLQFDKHDFEEYYPDEFSERVKKVLSIKDKKDKRENKLTLLKDVIEWLDSDENDAKTALKKSAAPVIKLLKTISDSIKENDST